MKIGIALTKSKIFFDGSNKEFCFKSNTLDCSTFITFLVKSLSSGVKSGSESLISAFAMLRTPREAPVASDSVNLIHSENSAISSFFSGIDTVLLISPEANKIVVSTSV